MKANYTRDEVIKMIDKILEHADAVMDAITNEHTDWYGETLLQLVETE